MTVLTQTNTQPAQAMDGVATVFAFTFRALVDFPDAIKVAFLDTLTDTETAGIKDDPGVNGYTVAINSDGLGGAITVIDPKTSDDTITIYREYTLIQESNYADFNSFPADTVENDYDLSTMVDQQNAELISRALVLPITVTGVDTTLPVPLANAPIGWNAAADGLTNNPTLTALTAIDAASTPDYLGATGADGVLRIGASLLYVDGGDFVTLSVNLLDEDNMISDSAFQAATQQSIKAYQDAHSTSDGSQHTFIDQSVISGASPTFDGANITGVDAANVDIVDAGGYLAATDVEGAFQEIVPEIDLNTTHRGLTAPHRLINDAGSSATELFSSEKINSLVQGIDWQDSVIDIYDPTAATPPGPSTGDRYISSATANGWTDTYIYEWNGATWDETIPNEGYATWVEDEDVQYVFNGTSWVKFGSTVDHVNLLNIGTNTHAQVDTHISGDGSDHSQVPLNAVATLDFIIDGGGLITTGIKGDIEIPFACVINQVTLLADQASTSVIDIWKDTYANYPADVTDTITAAAKPTLTAANKSQDATLTGWTTAIAAGDCLRFNVDSNDAAERITISLKVTKV